MIDFTSCKRLYSNLDGAGIKIQVEYNGSPHILKFGEKLDIDPKKPLQGAYRNTPVCEWLGSQVYRHLGLPAQEVLLGAYEGELVVACKNFLSDYPPTAELMPFKNIENSIVGSSYIDRYPHLETLDYVIGNHRLFRGWSQQARDRYWDMFVIDALIGNFDRHAGNWGYIVDRESNRIIDLAPVYDSGSSFTPMLNPEWMIEYQKDSSILVSRALQFPKAALKVEDRKVAYHEVLMSEYGEHARERLYNLADAIESLDIKAICASQDIIEPYAIGYYDSMVKARLYAILAPAYQLYCAEHGIDQTHEWAQSAISLPARADKADDAPDWGAGIR